MVVEKFHDYRVKLLETDTHLNLLLTEKSFEFMPALRNFFRKMRSNHLVDYKIILKIQTYESDRNQFYSSLNSSILMSDKHSESTIMASLDAYFDRYYDNEEVLESDNLVVNLIFQNKDFKQKFKEQTLGSPKGYNIYQDQLSKSYPEKPYTSPNERALNDLYVLKNILRNINSPNKRSFSTKTRTKNYEERKWIPNMDIDKSPKYKRKTNEPLSYYAADFETITINKDGKTKHIVYAAGFVHSESKKIITSNINTDGLNEGNAEERSLDLLIRFIDQLETYHMSTKQKAKAIIYFHNFGNFDGIFLIKAIIKRRPNNKIKILKRNNSYYEMEYTNRVTLKFQDSYKIIPIPLSKANKAFNLPVSKNMEFDTTKVNLTNVQHHIAEALDYMETDIKTTMQMLKKFDEAIFELQPKFNWTACLTISSISFSLFRLFYLKPNSKIYKSVHNLNTHKSILRSYKGGLTELYEPYSNDLNNFYDLNSAYPYVMKTKDMPLGQPTFERNIAPGELKDFFGFLDVIVSVPKSTHKPLLNIKVKGRNIYPTGLLKMSVFSEELKFAVDNNLAIVHKIICGNRFERGSIFEDFIDEIYSIKSNKNTSEGLRFTSKIILNSLFGRFSLGYIQEKSIVTSKEEADIIEWLFPTKSRTDIGNKSIVEISSAGDPQTLQGMHDSGLYTPSELSDSVKLFNQHNQTVHNQNIAVQISSAITSYGRIEIYKQILEAEKSGGRVLYTDTDSVLTNATLPTNSTELGKLGLDGKFSEVLILGPKFYIARNVDGTLKTSWKGIPKAERDKMQKDGENIPFDIENFKQFLKKDSKLTHHYKRNFIKDHKSFDVLTNHIGYSTQFELRKRNKVFDDQGNWISTTPIHFEDLKTCELIAGSDAGVIPINYHDHDGLEEGAINAEIYTSAIMLLSKYLVKYKPQTPLSKEGLTLRHTSVNLPFQSYQIMEHITILLKTLSHSDQSISWRLVAITYSDNIISTPNLKMKDFRNGIWNELSNILERYKMKDIQYITALFTSESRTPLSRNFLNFVRTIYQNTQLLKAVEFYNTDRSKSQYLLTNLEELISFVEGVENKVEKSLIIYTPPKNSLIVYRKNLYCLPESANA